MFRSDEPVMFIYIYMLFRVQKWAFNGIAICENDKSFANYQIRSEIYAKTIVSGLINHYFTPPH